MGFFANQIKNIVEAEEKKHFIPTNTTIDMPNNMVNQIKVEFNSVFNSTKYFGKNELRNVAETVTVQYIPSVNDYVVEMDDIYKYMVSNNITSFSEALRNIAYVNDFDKSIGIAVSMESVVDPIVKLSLMMEAGLVDLADNGEEVNFSESTEKAVNNITDVLIEDYGLNAIEAHNNATVIAEDFIGFESSDMRSFGKLSAAILGEVFKDTGYSDEYINEGKNEVKAKEKKFENDEGAEVKEKVASKVYKKSKKKKSKKHKEEVEETYNYVTNVFSVLKAVKEEGINLYLIDEDHIDDIATAKKKIDKMLHDYKADMGDGSTSFKPAIKGALTFLLGMVISGFGIGIAAGTLGPLTIPIGYALGLIIGQCTNKVALSSYKEILEAWYEHRKQVENRIKSTKNKEQKKRLEQYLKMLNEEIKKLDKERTNFKKDVLDALIPSETEESIKKYDPKK